MNYQRGDVVLADLPYSDRSGSKKPAHGGEHMYELY